VQVYCIISSRSVRRQTGLEMTRDLVTSLRSNLAAAVGWWLRELAGLVPHRIRNPGRRERRSSVLILGRERSVVLLRTAEGERPLGSVDTSGPDHDQRLGELLKQAKRRGRTVTVRLSEELGLRKILELPAAAKDDLNQVLRFEMDRLTPFRADEVCFAHRVVGSDARNRRLSVELQLAPQREIDRVLQTARRFGLSPARIELARGAEGGDPLNLLSGDSGPGTRDGRLNRALALLALVLAMGAVAIPLQRQRATVAELESEVSAARALAEESLAMRDRLGVLTKSAQFVLADKTRQPLVVQVLDELTRLIPDQAHLLQLELRDQTVELHGFASTASDLIGLLEQSPLFKAPQFRAPVTQDRRSGAERFHISVELTSGEGG
jgi:general secretion pathway protein L